MQLSSDFILPALMKMGTWVTTESCHAQGEWAMCLNGWKEKGELYTNTFFLVNFRLNRIEIFGKIEHFFIF